MASLKTTSAKAHFLLAPPHNCLVRQNCKILRSRPFQSPHALPAYFLHSCTDPSFYANLTTCSTVFLSFCSHCHSSWMRSSPVSVWEFLFTLQGPSQVSPPLGGLSWGVFLFLLLPEFGPSFCNHIPQHYHCFLVCLHSSDCSGVLFSVTFYLQARKVPVHV